MTSRKHKLNEACMGELSLLPSSIAIAACSTCLKSRDTYHCLNKFLCKNCVGSNISNVESVIRDLRQSIWKKNGTPSQRHEFLVKKLVDNTTTDGNGVLTVIYHLNGIKVCKSYFRVSNQ
jgi:hypothetical protein